MSSNNYRFRGINLTSSVVTNLSNVVGTTVTAALNTLNAALGAITSDMVQNLSAVAGATVTAALNALNTNNPGRGFDDIGITAIPDSILPLIIATAPFSTTAVDPNVQVFFTASVEATGLSPIIANYEIQVDGVTLVGSERTFSVSGFGGGGEFRPWATSGIVNLLAPGAHAATLVVTSATVDVGDSLTISPSGILTVARW